MAYLNHKKPWHVRNEYTEYFALDCFFMCICISIITLKVLTTYPGGTSGHEA